MRVRCFLDDCAMRIVCALVEGSMIDACLRLVCGACGCVFGNKVDDTLVYSCDNS